MTSSSVPVMKVAGAAVWQLREVPGEVVSGLRGLVELEASSDGGSAWGVERQPWLGSARSRSSWRRKGGRGRRWLLSSGAWGAAE